MMIKSFFLVTTILFCFNIQNKVHANANINSTNPLLELWSDETNSKSKNPTNTHYIYKKPSKGTFFKNVYHGYSFYYPFAWKIDTHQIPNYARLYHHNFRIDITVQNTARVYSNNNTYIGNTLAPIKSLVTKDTQWVSKGKKFRLVEFERNTIPNLLNDMNKYIYLFIENNKIVYTFQLKTTEKHYKQKLIDIKRIASTFNSATPKTFNLNTTIPVSNPEISYRFESKSLQIPKNAFLMGFYTSDSKDVELLSKKIESPIGSQFFYKPIDSMFDIYTKQLLDKNRLPVVSFLLENANGTSNNRILPEIISGKYDKYIENWAVEIKKLDGPVFIRFGNEMNGKWTQWSHKNSYNDPDLYKLAYRHFSDVFRSNNVNNAYFIWNPNSNSSPFYEWNHASMYYPGDDVVDWVGLTAYNFGNGSHSRFLYFDSLYKKLYNEYNRSYYGKPMMITEFGSVETGGSKAKFINEFFAKIPTEYPNIKIALWFSHKHDHYDFRVGTSVSSVNAFKSNMKKSNVIKGTY